MLRNFEYKPTLAQVTDILQQFELDVSIDKSQIALLKFEVITPDSFMWRLCINDNVYYVYAEDHIPSLDYVRKVFNSYLESDKWDFVNPGTIIDKGVQHAVKSGYDSVFLVKSVEEADDAQFSGNAPRGFMQ